MEIRILAMDMFVGCADLCNLVFVQADCGENRKVADGGADGAGAGEAVADESQFYEGREPGESARVKPREPAAGHVDERQPRKVR